MEGGWGPTYASRKRSRFVVMLKLGSLRRDACSGSSAGACLLVFLENVYRATVTVCVHEGDPRFLLTLRSAACFGAVDVIVCIFGGLVGGLVKMIGG